MHELLYGIIPSAELPSIVVEPSFLGSEFSAKPKQNEDLQNHNNRKQKEKLKQEEFAAPEDRMAHEEMQEFLRSDYAWFSSDAILDQAGTERALKKLIKSHRVRSSDDVDPFHAVELFAHA